MTVTSASEIANGDLHAMLLRDVERCARRYHDLQQALNSSEHKFWKFERCPATACREMRRHLPGLGIEDAALLSSSLATVSGLPPDAPGLDEILAACGRVFEKRKRQPGPITGADVADELGAPK